MEKLSLQDDAQVLEIFDQFDGKHLPSPMPDDTVCNFSNSSIEADIVKEAITVKNKPKESSLLSSDAALHIAKQLSSYISESAEGNMFYLVTQAIKGEKCDPGNEAMHVIHAVIKETDCDKKENLSEKFLNVKINVVRRNKIYSMQRY
ncbi:hypothetical protein D917_00990 [Trichinella nativa]|uniref:Uncharacterized protein n=1 Tax=Trichinella nativa TaxID=6335 RepID=A0A1Y3EVV5_9BILA|nr:hypothetical protein D917_00990 [Trichinella nativa]